MNIEPQRDPKELFTKFKVNFEKKGAYLEFHFDKLFELLLISRSTVVFVGHALKSPGRSPGTWPRTPSPKKLSENQTSKKIKMVRILRE